MKTKEDIPITLTQGNWDQISQDTTIGAIAVKSKTSGYYPATVLLCPYNRTAATAALTQWQRCSCPVQWDTNSRNPCQNVPLEYLTLGSCRRSESWQFGNCNPSAAAVAGATGDPAAVSSRQLSANVGCIRQTSAQPFIACLEFVIEFRIEDETWFIKLHLEDKYYFVLGYFELPL